MVAAAAAVNCSADSGSCGVVLKFSFAAGRRVLTSGLPNANYAIKLSKSPE
jgi:hypothetical protein